MHCANVRFASNRVWFVCVCVCVCVCARGACVCVCAFVCTYVHFRLCAIKALHPEMFKCYTQTLPQQFPAEF